MLLLSRALYNYCPILFGLLASDALWIGTSVLDNILSPSSELKWGCGYKGVRRTRLWGIGQPESVNEKEIDWARRE
jgi:hypothetical protein